MINLNIYASFAKKRIHELEDELESTRIKLDSSQNNVETLKNLRDLVMKVTKK